jgi:Retrotransposon gag protein
MAAVVPPPGALYANPLLPADFGLDAATVAAIVPNTTLVTCYAVTTGPDRNIYWVYGHMAQTATAIPLGSVAPPCCFETQQSMATSQNKTRPRQICITCGRSVSNHATATQATAAFTAHARAFPATHVTINAVIAPGVTAPLGFAATNGITAPIPATVVVPLPGPVPLAPAAPLAPVAPIGPVVAIGPNTPSIQAPAAQYKLLTDMVKINPQLVWSDTQDAHRFLIGLESILEFSPVLHAHWTTLIILMIPGQFELERSWVRTNIMTPLLSWNAAKAAFTAHFQRGDYMDGLRWLYAACRQQPQETVQEYSRRFQTISTQLGFADNDVQSIYKFISGLNDDVQHKMTSHKTSMRTVGAAPTWDFTSLVNTAQLAITIGTQPIYTQQIQTTILYINQRPQPALYLIYATKHVNKQIVNVRKSPIKLYMKKRNANITPTLKHTQQKNVEIN